MIRHRSEQLRRYEMSRNELFRVEYQEKEGGDFKLAITGLAKENAESYAELWKRLKFCHDTRVMEGI